MEQCVYAVKRDKEILYMTHFLSKNLLHTKITCNVDIHFLDNQNLKVKLNE